MRTPVPPRKSAQPSPGVTRRRFVKTAGGSAAALAIPAIIPASALGRNGATPPSERIVLGAIGVGGRGWADLRALTSQKDVQAVAVCDVRANRRASAKGLVDSANRNKDCATFIDMQEMLAKRRDLDAVLIATGDRWHARASILAMEAGLDVYCEKPGTMTIAEGQDLVKAAATFGRVFQTGAQRLSEPNFVFATELARSGRLGRIETVRAHLWHHVRDVTHNAWLPEQPLPDPAELDWNRWLGPVPYRPYNKEYLGGCGAWGIYWDLAAGVAGWGSHTIIQCQAAIRSEHAAPVSYGYPGNKSGDGLEAAFADGVKLVMQLSGWRGSCGVRFEGTDGWVSIADGYRRPDASHPALLDEFETVVNRYREQTGRSLSHLRDFLDCVRSRRTPMAGPQFTHASMTANHAMNLCLYLERDLEWDPKTETFAGDDEANRMRARAARSYLKA